MLDDDGQRWLASNMTQGEEETNRQSSTIMPQNDYQLPLLVLMEQEEEEDVTSGRINGHRRSGRRKKKESWSELPV